MSTGKATKSYQVLRSRKGVSEKSTLEMIGEEPLEIRVEDKSYSVVMRTPGEEVFHAAGFCLGEGIADSPDDFKNIGYDENLDPNVIDIWLKPERRQQIGDILERKRFVSQTSCGICGKEMTKDLQQRVTPLESNFTIDINSFSGCMSKLSENQKHYQTTRGSHAALIFNNQLDVVAFAEDVGRHNALDKAIGKTLMEGTLSQARMLVLSSRISYEMVQKAARAHLPVIISDSRPTTLAVEMGKALNMTLAFPDNGSGLIIICGENRIKNE